MRPVSICPQLPGKMPAPLKACLQRLVARYKAKVGFIDCYWQATAIYGFENMLF
jgi:hypothetical protein